MSHRFDHDTTTRRLSDGEHEAELAAAWNIGPVPNGGYQAALSCRAALVELGAPDLVNVTSYFVGASAPGPTRLRVEVLKRGRSNSMASVSLAQGGRERVRSLVAAGDLGALTGLELHHEGPPEMPAPERCLHLSPAVTSAPEVLRQVELRLDPATAAFARGERGAATELRGWLRFADGRPADGLALAFFADVLPPTVFNHLGVMRWVPTLELTTQVRRRPAPGWVRLRMVTRHVSAGHFEEDGEIWDERGELVALSRQRAMILGE